MIPESENRFRNQCRSGKDGSSGLPDMKLQRTFMYTFDAGGVVAFLRLSAFAPRKFKGTVIDPSQSPIPGAQVAAVNDVGVIVEQITDDQGHFDFNVSPLFENYQLRVTAPGFQTVTVGRGRVR